MYRWVLGALVTWVAFAMIAHARPNVAFRHILPDELEYIGFFETIAQDKMGFMWFGGRNGLARFDGYEIKRFVEDGKSGSLVSSQINDLLVARDGTLWVATGTGLHSYLPETEIFKSILQYADGTTNTFDAAPNDIRALLESDEGGLWLGTRAGLVYYDTKTSEFQRYYHSAYPEGTGNRQINVLEKADAGKIWIGKSTGGLSLFDPATSSFEHFRHNPNDPNSLSDNDIRALFVDRDNTLWIGTYRGGLNEMRPDGLTFKRYPYNKTWDNDDVWEIVQDKRGIIWIGDGGGLTSHNKVTGETHRFRPDEDDPNSLSSRNIRTLFLDRAGDLWAGFLPSGVDYLDPQASVFRNYISSGRSEDRLLGNGVRDTYIDENRDLWIATGNGLSFLNRKENTFMNYQYDENNDHGPAGNIVISVIGDKADGIWFGIYGEGLNRLDRQTGKIKRYTHIESQEDTTKEGALLGSQPYDMTFTRDGTLWIATNKGINKYNADTDDFTHYVPPSQFVDGQNFYTRSIYEDSYGNIWIGSTRGLFLFDRKTETFLQHKHDPLNPYGLNVDFVLCTLDDGAGSLWVGTKGGGLLRYDYETKRFLPMQAQLNIDSDVISDIIIDKNSDIWLATHSGLVRYSPDNQQTKTFSKKDGLAGNLFPRKTLSLSEDGEIVAGSTEGLTVFRPDEIWENPYIPPVWPTELSIFNETVSINSPNSPLTQSISLQKELVLNHEQSFFSLTFAALNYRSPQENQYQFKLEGFDKDWHAVSKRRTVTYTNLDPGEYVMRVRAANNNGLWNNEGNQVKIKVLPPYWRSNIAYLIYAAAFIGMIYLIIQINIRKQIYERERSLNQSLQSLDKLKDEFLANTSHELRTPLNGIIGLSESLLDDEESLPADQRKQFLRMIHFSGKRLSHLVDDILDFSKLKSHTLYLNKKPIRLNEFLKNMMVMLEPLIGGKPVTLINEVSDDVPLIEADEKRLQQIFFNLVGNAIKFTDKGSVSISAKQFKQHLVISIVDTGIGIPDNKLNKIFELFEQVDSDESREYGGTGLGLTITQKLVELHGGTITVSSKEGHGSRFNIQLPIFRQHTL